jgi:hypothetical protein
VRRHIDLVVKQQITAVSGVDLPARNSAWQCSIPRALHYGVWELPIATRLPAPTSRLIPAAWSTWSTWRQIRCAAAGAATYHLMIDAPALVDCASGALKTVDWLLRHVADWRARGLVCVETLAAGALRLSEVPSRTPQYSILRRAA